MEWLFMACNSVCVSVVIVVSEYTAVY
jgi:hypothetical protein